MTRCPPTVAASSALLLALAATANQLPGEYPRLSRSRFWEPYAYEAATLALFHLDEQGPKTELLDLDDLAAPTADPLLDRLDLPGKRPTGQAAATGKSSANANPMAAAAELRGDAKLVADGRFGGGLRFAGAGALYAEGLAYDTAFRTLEFWLRLDQPPAAPRVVAAFGPKPHETFARLLIHPDHTLEVEWQGQPTGWPGVHLPANQWRHLAIGVGSAWPTGPTLHFLLDGTAVEPRRIPGGEASTAARQSACIWIGGDRGGTDGVVATVDEVRISSTLRDYYPDHFSWVQPDQPPTAASQPYWRDPADLLFHLDFNHGTRPARAVPGTAHREVAITEADLELAPAKIAATFPPGVHGRALMLGAGSLRPTYGAAGNLHPPQGSIAFWMRPVDWDNFTRDNRFDSINPTTFGLFQLDATTVPGSNEAIYRKIGPLLQFTVNLHLPEDADAPPPLHPGAWTHIVATWEGKEFTYYVDGQRRDPHGAFAAALEIRTANDPYPYHNAQARWWTESTPVTLRFQENRYWEQRGLPMPRTAIDDFRIYRRPLAPAEIANLAALHDPRRSLEPLPVAEMAMAYNGVAGRVRATVIPLAPDYQEVATVTLSLTRDDTGQTVGETTVEIEPGQTARPVLDTPPLDFAPYTVTAKLADAAGQPRGQVAESFLRTPPPWWQSQAGRSERVMPPWTPVQAAANVLSVWGRELHVGGDGLPQKIISQGQDILAAPIRFEATLDGQVATLTPAPLPQATAVSEVRGEVAGELRSPHFTLRTESHLEFDGLLWLAITLTPTPGATPTLDRLSVRIPQAADSATTLHWWSGNRNFREPKHVWIGDLPAGDGPKFRSDDRETVRLLDSQRGSFIPYLLLTGDQRGLAWFAENDRGWTQTDGTPAVSIVRQGDTVELILNLIAEPVQLAEPRQIAFGLQPIPVRPLDPLWRQYPGYSNVHPDTFSGNNLKGRKGPSTFYLYPEDDWEAVKRRIDGEGLTKGAAGIKGHYLNQLKRLAAAGIADPPPQTITVPGLYWDMQWNGIPPSLTHTREWAETWAVDYQYYTPEFVDFCSWAWNDWVEKTDTFVRGAYLDDCWGAPLTKPGGPTTYTLPDGHLQPGFQFLGPRERFKRMRQISADHGVWPHFTAHTTHTFFIPYHSFFELILDGEDHYSNPPRQSDFLDHWSPDRLRFMNNAKWGLVTTWLGWTGNSTPVDNYPAWTFRQTRAYRAGLALHDIMWPFPGEVVADFGLRQPDSEFLAYWRQPEPAKHDHPHLHVSAWKRPGRCLLLLVNLGDERLEADLRPNLAALGFANLDPDRLQLLDRDADLLTYFKEDNTQIAAPTLDQNHADDELTLDERDDELPLDERRARDPDGQFAWQNGTLRCPVRRHDYRLFELRPPTP